MKYQAKTFGGVINNEQIDKPPLAVVSSHSKILLFWKKDIK